MFIFKNFINDYLLTILFLNYNSTAKTILLTQCDKNVYIRFIFSEWLPDKSYVS